MFSGGTCSGTAMDQTPHQSGTTGPKLFLKPGDKREASIDKLGTLRNHIVAARANRCDYSSIIVLDQSLPS